MPAREGCGWNWKQDRSRPSLVCSVRTFAKANCPHRTPFYFYFLPAPMAADEMSLVQITTSFSGLRKWLYDTFRVTIVGIFFNGKSRTFSGSPGNKSGFPYARSHPNRQRSHKPYAQSHRRQKRYLSGY